MRIKTQRQHIEESRKQSFEENYQSVIKYIEYYLDIKLINLEMAAVREQLKYVFDVCTPLPKFNRKDKLDFMGSYCSPSTSLEVLAMYAMQYNVDFAELRHNGGEAWFKQEFRRRRDECIML